MGSTDGCCRLWDVRVDGSAAAATSCAFSRGQLGLTAVCVSPYDESSVAIGSETGGIAVLDLRRFSSGACKSKFVGSSTLDVTAVMGDSKGRPCTSFGCPSSGVHSGAVRGIHFLSGPPNETILTCGDDGTVRMCNIAISSAPADTETDPQGVMSSSSAFGGGVTLFSEPVATHA